MVSIIAPILILTASLLGGTQASESISSEKIIIHVPYKIHNHLHTHTNYKVIKVPENDEKLHETTGDEEEMKYLNKEIDSILSGTKLPQNIKHTESQFKPQLFHSFDTQASTIPAQSYHDLKDVKKLGGLHGIQAEAHTESLSSPTRLPTLSPAFHTTMPDYQYGEGNIYYHTFATKTPFVPFYNAQIVNPTYQVEEKQSSDEILSQKTTSYELLGNSNKVSKSTKDAFIRNYIQKNPHSIRSGKFLPSTKTFRLATTKLYSLPTKPTKTFAISTSKNFLVSTTKPPKTLFKNNEEYEHIGYLVVGENSQKFVGINNRKK